ncbi:MAG: DUF5011 domain-containing protein [Lachnospiraceae bacterium]|nr:DUF5011 domain-containing protein [Lachnospiraceae bacterium]
MKTDKWIITISIVISVLLIGLTVFLWIQSDRVAPRIEFSVNETVYTEGMDDAPLYEGVSATDSCDGDVSDRVVIEKIVENKDTGRVTVTYAVSDRSGNVAKASRVFGAVFETAIETQEEPVEDAESEAE